MTDPEASIILTTHFDVTSADTDMYSRLRLGGLVNFLIQAAIQSADSLGFGFGGLKSQQLFWVLSRMTVEIYRPLKWYEKVQVTTWPKDIDRLLYIRDFEVTDQQGQVVAKATSGWLAIDFQNKKPRHVGDAMDHILNRLREKHALNIPPLKLDATPEGEIFQTSASYFDIDLNKHVTSTRYIDWMMDSLEPAFHKEHYPRQLSVNYLRETMPGDNIRINRHKIHSGLYSFEGFNLMKNSNSFRALIEF